MRKHCFLKGDLMFCPRRERYKISDKELSAARTVRSVSTEESAKEKEIDVPDITAQQSGAFICACSF